MKVKICKTVEVCGKMIYYELSNPELKNQERPVLVFLHEGLGSIKQWKDFPELIGKKVNCPVLVYDRYGYGKSEALSEARTTDYLEKEASLFLPELLDKLEILGKIILIGHSDGGSISLLFASIFPDKVLGLITEADHLFCEEITTLGIKDLVHEFENGKLSYSLSYYHGKKTDLMFYGWSDVWLSEQNKEWNMENCLSSITCPVLAIQGKEDKLGSELQLISKKKNIKGLVEILFVDDCGHIPHFQAVDVVQPNIISFICKCMALMN